MNFSNFLAAQFLSGEVLGVLIPLLAIGLALGNKILTTLTSHQREMALIISNQQAGINPNSGELISIKEEVRQLREIVANQTIAIDELKTSSIMNTPIQTRIQENV
jgi:hypothetical protein